MEFLKELLNLTRDVVTAEHAQAPIEKEEEGKAALTELFYEVKKPRNADYRGKGRQRHRRDRALNSL